MNNLSTTYYQIILSQGLRFAVGAGGIFTTGVVRAGQRFEKKRRGFPRVIMTSGGSVGTFIAFLNSFIL